MTTTRRIAMPYDTETTGLPIWGSPSEDSCQPNITQIAAELVDIDSREVIASLHCLIKPEGRWTIPEDCTALNGITTGMCEEFGVPIKYALGVFLRMWNIANAGRIAHNESFDMRMIRIELMQSGKFSQEYADAWKAGLAFCTMRQSTKIVNIGKSPKLSEAYQHFTGKPLVGAHRANVDVMACKEVFFGIQDYNATPAAA